MKGNALNYFDAFVHAKAAEKRRTEQGDYRFTGRSHPAIEYDIFEIHVHFRS
jgi:hypothetical protein